MINRLRQALLDSETLLQIIDIQNEVVQEGLEFERIAFLVARRSQEICKAEGAVIEIREDNDMVYRATSGIADPQLGLRVDFGQSLSGLCVREGKAQICLDSEVDPRVNKEACRKVGLRSMIVIPLVFKEKAIGVLKVMSSKAGGFVERDIAILNILATLVGASLHTAEVYGRDELYINATTDLMTGLKNRSYFYDRLRSHFFAAQETHDVFGVFVLDMNSLKAINDAYGHRAGDSAIVEMVDRARRTLREADIFCRLGGDEFAIIVPHVKSHEDMERLKGRLVESVNHPYSLNGFNMDLGISIGYGLFSQTVSDIQELIETADRRMYEDKRKRKSGKIAGVESGAEPRSGAS
jgi:diguanylate cyclase (GGDEF)-like protein